MKLTGRRLTAYLGAGALSVTLAATVILSGAVSTHDGTVKDATVTPCVEEDSPGPCYWDAEVQGNGAGMSFWVDAEQAVHYDLTGSDWKSISQELGDALAEGEDATTTARDWESCKVNKGDVSFVVCPDGFTTAF